MRKKPTSQPPLYMKTFPLAQRTEIVHVGHHEAHAASAYYTCGSDEKFLVVTADGIGGGVSVCLWRGENGKLTLLEQFGAEGSLGWFYSNVTEALGWWHGDGEGKTMGLAPYGDASRVAGVLDGYHPVYANGSLVTPHDFGIPHYWNERGASQYHFEDADAIHELLGRHAREDIAAEAQRILEEQMFNVIMPWLDKEQTENLACAGGVFLNVKLNQRVWGSGRVQRHWPFPNAGDSGLAVGAALAAYHQACPSAPIGAIDNLYWGPAYDDDDIASIVELTQLSATRQDDPAGCAAALLAENKIVGWFQGRMESGPRALGSRSILMSPCQADSKDVINARVKFREGFRPFCPSLTIESAQTYLQNVRPERFTVTSFDVTEGKPRGKIPAVVHHDGTLRPQTVAEADNPDYWRLIRELGRLNGEEIVLNTSFNVMGEPIVCTPQEAIRCFFGNGMDTLFLGSWMISKHR
jgi:carbamoyltransferase